MKTKREEIKELIRKIQSQQKKEAGQSSAKGSPGEPEVGGEDTEEGVEIQIQNFPVSPWGALSGLTRLPTYSLLLWHDGPIYRVGLPLPGQAWRSVRLPSCCQGLITCCWITPPPLFPNCPIPSIYNKTKHFTFVLNKTCTYAGCFCCLWDLLFLMPCYTWMIIIHICFLHRCSFFRVQNILFRSCIMFFMHLTELCRELAVICHL